MTSRLFRIGPLALLFVCLFLTDTLAQSLGRVEQTESTTNSFFVYTRPGDLTIQVYVMGAARFPGLYEISVGTDLRQLLALSGGPNLRERLEDEETRTYVRLFRTGTEPIQSDDELDAPSIPPIFQGLLENTVTTPESYPVLQEGDLITLDVVRDQGFDIRTIFSVVAAIGTVALAIERISNTR